MYWYHELLLSKYKKKANLWAISINHRKITYYNYDLSGNVFSLGNLIIIKN